VNHHHDAIVIGAGAAGLASAYQLSRRRMKVLVLEKGYPGCGSTGRCIGGIRQQFSTPGAIRLMRESVRQFRQMEAEFGSTIEYYEGGYLFLAHDSARMETFRAILPLQRELGLRIDLLSPEECLKLVPVLNGDGLVGGVYSSEDGQAYPFKVLAGYISGIRKNGAEVLPYTEVDDLIIEQQTVKGVRTRDGGTYYSDVVLNACGPWASAVGKMAGVELPVTAEGHEAFITDRQPRLFETMIVDYRSDGCYFYQRTNGQVIGCYSPVPSRPGIHSEATREFLVEMPRRALRLVPRLETARVIRHWGGSYEMTPDGSPIIDRTPVKGYYVAVGLSGHGFMFAPAIGTFVSQIILDDVYPFDWAEFKLDRDYSRNELMK